MHRLLARLAVVLAAKWAQLHSWLRCDVEEMSRIEIAIGLCGAALLILAVLGATVLVVVWLAAIAAGATPPL